MSPAADSGRAERSPEPQVIARRELDLHLGRVLEVTAIDDATGHTIVWLRVRARDGKLIGQLHVRPSSLRPVGDTLAAMAAELGVEP
jgi:hypothetical protein